MKTKILSGLIVIFILLMSLSVFADEWDGPGDECGIDSPCGVCGYTVAGPHGTCPCQDPCSQCTDNDDDNYWGGNPDYCTDCNDANPGIHPGVVEACNGVDDNCNGQIDETADWGVCGTNEGVCTTGTYSCTSGNLICEGANMGSEEVYDGLDNDCDGIIDNGFTDYITTSYDYDSAYSYTFVTNERQITTKTKSDRFGNLVEILEDFQGADQSKATYEYDLMGRLKKIRNYLDGGEILETTNTYNKLGQIVSEDHPDTGLTTFTYDLSGNVIKSVDGEGRTIFREYDNLNRITKVKWVMGGENVTYVQYFYDGDAPCINTENAIGKLCRIVDLFGEGSIDFLYDQRGRIVQEDREVEGANYVTVYTYDNAGRLKTMTYPSGKMLGYDYNVLSQLERVYVDNNKNYAYDSSDRIIVDGYEYEDTGVIKQFTYGNGIETSYSYNLRNWLTSISSAVVQRSYTYDVIGNLETIHKSGDLFASFMYDRLDRVKNVDSNVLGDQTYSYDDFGNRQSLVVDYNDERPDVSRSYTYEYETSNIDSVQLKSTSDIGIDFTYDNVGNLETDPAGYVYHYNFHNQLIQADFPDGSQEFYFYDYLGNRIKKIDNTGKTILYLYDLNSQLIEEIEATDLTILADDSYLGPGATE
jgi:YD repeat-containing protein